jgi:hypothetical protein
MPQALREASAKPEKSLFEENPAEKPIVRTVLEQQAVETLSTRHGNCCFDLLYGWLLR